MTLPRARVRRPTEAARFQRLADGGGGLFIEQYLEAVLRDVLDYHSPTDTFLRVFLRPRHADCGETFFQTPDVCAVIFCRVIRESDSPANL